jgi:hypothetical protein
MITSLVGLFGAALLLERLDRNDRLRELRRAPLDDAAKVRDGDVAKVVVRLAPDCPVLESPLTGTRCLAWRLTVEERQPTAGSVVFGETNLGVLRGTSPDGVRVVLASDGRARVRFGEPTPWQEPSDAVRALLASSGRPARANETLRCEEETLPLGATITVLGWARWRSSQTDGEYREAPRELVLSGDASQPLLVSSRAEHRR